jgi:hypothetical protein
MFLGHLDPDPDLDPIVRCKDPDPDPSNIKQKNFDCCSFATFYL